MLSYTVGPQLYHEIDGVGDKRGERRADGVSVDEDAEEEYDGDDCVEDRDKKSERGCIWLVRELYNNIGCV